MAAARPARFLRRLLAVALALALALLALEGWLRWSPPEVLLEGSEEPIPAGHHFRTERGKYVLDPELGFRPAFGTTEYTELGTVRNEYALEKPDGVRRILFLGDSVTHRGQIVRALRQRLGEEGFEYWNAGVEAYGTAQEVAYFERYGLALEPDDVVLTFHLNDFEVTPTLFLDGDGELRVFHPELPTAVDPWLFEHSYIYRLFLGLRLASARSPLDAMAAEVRDALARLRDTCAAHGIRLRVLVMPILGPYDDLSAEWREEIEERHPLVAGILDALGIEWIDLTEPHDATLAAGYAVRVAPHDPMHPGPAAAAAFAEHALEHGLLDEDG